MYRLLDTQDKALQHHTPLNQPTVTKFKNKPANLEKHNTLNETVVNLTSQHLITLKNAIPEQNLE